MIRLVTLVIVAATVCVQPALAQQEKGDVPFRDLNIAALGFINMHSAVYWQYNGGDPPDDPHNSSEIEMLDDQTNRIIDETLFLFTDAARYHGPFSHPCARSTCPYGPLTRPTRLSITQTARSMELRSPLIVYVSTPTIEYLDWSGSSGQQLTLSNIQKMRSDAVVEFAYALNGFPIVHPYGWTIVANPNQFITMADSTLLGLKPSNQQAAMVPAIAIAPVATVYDASGSQIFSGGASSMTSISVNVFDEDSGPGGLELWQGAVDTGVLLASNTVAFNATQHLYTSSDSGLSNLGSLSDGQYSIRAIDQAGNWSTSLSVVNFMTKDLPLVVERRHDAVFQNGLFGVVKFSEGSLLYRQAGSPSCYKGRSCGRFLQSDGRGDRRLQRSTVC